MHGDLRRRVAPGALTAALAVLLASCGNMLAPGPDGVMWLNGCDVAHVTEDGLEMVLEGGDRFCPQTIEVDETGLVWGAGESGEVWLGAGDRWIRVDQPVSEFHEPVIALDLSVGTDGRVWVVTTSAVDPDDATVEVHGFSDSGWITYRDASGAGFGTAAERTEPPNRILAPLPRGRMSLVTSEGLYLYDLGRWIRLLRGEFTTVSATPDGDLWFAGPSGIYVWPAEDLPR